MAPEPNRCYEPFGRGATPFNRNTSQPMLRRSRCSACHIAISPMMFQKLRRGEDFDQCPSCQRILYFRPEPLPEDEAASTDEGAEKGGSESSA